MSENNQNGAEEGRSEFSEEEPLSELADHRLGCDFWILAHRCSCGLSEYRRARAEDAPRGWRE